MDINALATVLIAQKTGAVINTTSEDMKVEEKFDHCSQKEALVRIFQSPLFSSPHVKIHPNHDLETLGTYITKFLPQSSWVVDPEGEA